MKGYLPIDREQRTEMLADVGIGIEDLFAAIPEEIRLRETDFAHLAQHGLSEMEIRREISALADKNISTADYDSYLGAGIYDHFTPAAVSHLIGRQEFLTAYTPYQAEISQGTLRAIFEWQSYICRLTGLDVSNSSMYDGASAAAEAMLLAIRATRRDKVWISGGLNPEYIDTIKTYLLPSGFTVEVGTVAADGRTADMPTAGDYAAFLIQSPNFYGVVEDLAAFAEAAHAVGTLAAASCDPISLALLKRPGDLGIDIVSGEAQVLGVAQSFGGPALGYLAVKQKLMRQMPGRIAGETVDDAGNTAYVLTLQAREQHIRRERATSNICSNQALLATAATIYLALQGRSGLREVAEQSAARAIYLHDRLVATGLFKSLYNAAYFREFALQPVGDLDLKELNRRLLDYKILGGLVLPEKAWLLAVTEKKSQAQLDRLVAAVVEITDQVVSQ
ncbi:MAG: aminomethyl-transferring glycine dehydrogenase subunit GcvPA [Saccharofermentanales bacterium]|jgi:glycine dehydrogenase subunit 1|nr:aminomethyl-transferring glycine dehydrogenase subunit GcvPA [Bacillota bacterium]